MTRSEVIDQFRRDNPEIDSRVLSDAVIYDYLLLGDKDFCAKTRCIVDSGTTITTTENAQSFLLTTYISKFYDINDYPASGVLYNNKALEKTTMSALDEEDESWGDWSSGTPKKWYRHLNTLYLDRKIDANIDDIIVYSVLISDDWSSDVRPFNQLTTLEPYHYAMVLWLQAKAKAKVGKQEDSIKAMLEYDNYLKWVKSQLGGNKFAPIYFRPKAGMYS